MANSRLRTVVVVVVAIVLAGIAITSLRARSVPVAATGLPSPEEMDSLGVYLHPAVPAPDLDEYAVFLPAETGVRATQATGRAPIASGQPAEPAQASAMPLELSAIMIAGARPVAIINDEAVSAGSRLNDGSVVVQIERDYVIVQAPNGTRRRLTLTAG